MDVTFTYDTDKDIWCLLSKGKSSNNSKAPTRVYQELVASCRSNPTEEETGAFIENYLDNVDVQHYLTSYEKEWRLISDRYHAIAQNIFNAEIPNEIVAYLTINNRRPYNIAANYFYVTIPSASIALTVMHELWHFYTWYGLGSEEESRLGKGVYNDLKEALTVLINVECTELLPDNVIDTGYPQHAGLRKQILDLWNKEKNIKRIWNKISESYTQSS